jgi:putative membrane protein
MRPQRSVGGAKTVHRRFPRWVYGRGVEPDPRFSLANERTFLAWIRTSLALVAGGVALHAVQIPIAAGFRLASAFLLILLGLVAVCQGWFGWMRAERELRENRALSGPSLGPVVAVGVVVAVVLVGLGSLW